MISIVVVMGLAIPLAARRVPYHYLRKDKPIEYCLGRQIRTVAGPPTLVVYIGVKPRNFNRQDMSKLAHQLNTEFPNEPRLDVWIFDTCRSAKSFVPHPHSKTYDRDFEALRGFYRLDRQLGEETINFSSSPEKPRDEVKLDLRKGAV